MLTDSILLVRVSDTWIWYTDKYHFQTYSESDLDEIAKKGEPLIFRTNEKSDEYAMANWIFENEMVAGVRMETKLACDEEASITEVYFSLFPLTKTKVVKVQQAGLVEKKPKVNEGNKT